MGITKERLQLNGTKKEHIRKDIVCLSEDRESVTVNYTVSNIDPQLNCIFIVDILDHFNKSKTTNEFNFSEFNSYIYNKIIPFSHHSNLSCPRTHSTVLL